MIKVLDSFVADKIAAGEVIERPVSAVKELIENSIDAGASQIIVEIRGGGKSYIRVTDDGCGIPYDEAETAFLRHATSKISSITDLDRIGSLGFRGEALASISAVSRLTMVSRTEDSGTGIKLVMHGGKTVSAERTGANRGTTMIVEDLFYNTPARRKFMKSDAREASAVIELVQQFAVYYASVRFMMVNNGQTVFTTAGDGDPLSVIKSLYPEIARHDLLEISGSGVRGYVSDPGSTMTSRKGQLFFVNGRLVSGSVMEKAVEAGYNGRIFSGFPVAILFIEADPAEIDVNIHPGKREIRFFRADEISGNISDAVSAAVMTAAGVPSALTLRDDVSRHQDEEATRQEQAAKTHEAASPLAAYSDEQGAAGSLRVDDAAESNDEVKGDQTSIRDFLTSLEREPKPAEVSVYDEAEPPAKAYPAAASDVKEELVYRPFDFSELSFKGYVFDTYIIMQGRDSLYIFDQHAAHERVFYEKFMAGYNNATHVPQPILTAFTFNVSADVYCMERDWLEELRHMGYDVEDFGGCSFIVRGIPTYMTPEEAEGFIRGYSEAIEETSGINRIVIDKLIMKSCKSAVKAHDRLSELEIADLMDRLAVCSNPYSCPHGRPTFIKVTSYDIERSFRRK